MQNQTQYISVRVVFRASARFTSIAPFPRFDLTLIVVVAIVHGGATGWVDRGTSDGDDQRDQRRGRFQRLIGV